MEERPPDLYDDLRRELARHGRPRSRNATKGLFYAFQYGRALPATESFVIQRWVDRQVSTGDPPLWVVNLKNREAIRVQALVTVATILLTLLKGR